MRKLWVIAAAVILLALSVNAGRAEERESPKLAFELSALREAWLYGDDATAAARLDTLRRDNRLSGEFPRWYASLRAVLALKQNDTKTAVEVLQPLLETSQDARNYVRAARLLLAYGYPKEAQQVIDSGLQRAPDSPALLRFHAGLQWLQGDFDGALESYSAVICNDERPQYPYVSPATGRWSGTKPWNATGDKPPQAEKKNADEDYYYGDEQPASEYLPEPHTSLFLPLNWYPCDLPGLDRCLATIAADPEQVKARTGNLADLIKTARASQDELDALRTGDEEARKKLELKARHDRWKAVIALRLAAMDQLNRDETEQAEATAKLGLELAPDDVALLDLLVQSFGRLGKPEEARNQALTRLRTLAYLGVYSNTMYLDPGRQMMDRVFLPALNLYRANPEAGLTQIEQMRTTFGDASRNRPVYEGALGMWLAQLDEPDLARKYLREASRTNGYESGKPLYADSVVIEMALLQMGEGDVEENGDQPKNKPAPPKPDGEEDPVEVAKLDANANPLLRQSLRIGAVLGSVCDVRSRTRMLTGVDVYASVTGVRGVRTGARYLPDGDELMQRTLWESAEIIAEKVPAAEIDAFLAPEHTTSKTLETALKTMSELVDAAGSNNSWRTRQSLGQKAGPVLGMVEARTLLLRARLLQIKPKDMAGVKEFLARNQAQIDLRTQFKGPTSDEYTRFKQARTDAAIPEVVHTGLALDAARCLARAGKFEDAARLLWFNRDAPLGIQSVPHMLSLAAVFARKGGDDTLAIRCRLAAVGSAPDTRSSSQDPLLILTELPVTRRDLLEFGEESDLLSYIENMVIPYADSPSMLELARVVPELKDARPTLCMRNDSRTGTENIFSAAVANGNSNVIFRNWIKMMATPETFPVCHRFAGWVIACDLPVSTSRSSYSGMLGTRETLLCWSMLYELNKRAGANDPVALKETARLEKLLTTLAGSLNESEQEDDSDWWG